MNGYPLPVEQPYAQPAALAAPRAVPPPSQIPTDRLATQADNWAQGRGASPALPHPNPGYAYTQAQQNAPVGAFANGGGGYGGGPPSGGDGGYSAGGGPPTHFLQSSTNSGYQQGPPPPQINYGPPQPPQQPYYPQQQTGGHSQQSSSGSYYQPQPPQPPQGYYQQQQQQQQQPPQAPYPPVSPLPPQHQSQLGTPQQRPPRVASMMSEYGTNLSLDSLSLGGGPTRSTTPSSAGRPSYYATPEDGPPHKLAVTHPDQKMLASMRETAHAGTGDIHKKVAWAKQVLKFIERHQSSAGESSRINDPTLVRWTDEALKHILGSASSSSPVPLALYLRGDLSSSGSFPSYRSKDSKSAFRDFEAAANAGYMKAWFRIGRSYEDFGDVRRAVGAYEKGVEKGDCGSTYRLAMAYLLGQIGVVPDAGKAVALLKRAADTADLDTPQPPYILGMLLSGEFDSPAVKLQNDVVPLNIDEAKWRIERSAYLSFGPAQYKMGFSYEYATLGCLFDPLLSVQYYALASQNGEVEADMALSKWYLCGSEGNFDKNEQLAVTFAEKAASRSLPSAEFALGYFKEVGINGTIDLDQARRWYQRAASHGNDDAKKRLDALGVSESNALSRTDHETHVDTKLVRKRTQARIRSEEQTQAAASRPAPPTNGNYGGGDRRQSSTASASGYGQNNTLQRKQTFRQVEAAAGMAGPNGRAAPGGRLGSQFHGSPAPSLSSQQSVPNPHRQSYQLSDRPVSASPSVNGGGQGQGPRIPNQQQQQYQQQQQQEIQMKQKPSTFAEMGIATTKAKKDECLVM